MSLWRRVVNHFVPHHTNAYRPHLLQRGWMVIFLAVVLMTEGFLVASLVARQSGGSFLASVIQSQLIAMTNDERAQNSVGQLTENTLLDAAAQAKANDMAAKGYFSHQSPNGKQPWDFISAAGYNYQYAGENLAVRFVDSKDVINAWMASPTHRANIVKSQYKDVGIGIAEGTYKGEAATFVVQYFGTLEPSAQIAQVHDTAAEGQVLGAEVGPASANPVNSAVRQLPRLISDPKSSAGWILGAVAAILIVVLGLTFMMHLQVQPTDLLLPGTVVAGLAIFFLVFNGAVLSPVGQSQAAAAGAWQSGVVVVPQDGAAVQR